MSMPDDVTYSQPAVRVSTHCVIEDPLCDFTLATSDEVSSLVMKGTSTFSPDVDVIPTTLLKANIGTLATYSATLIDHIYSNATSQNYDSGIIICDVADHFGTFYASRKYSSKNLPTYTRTRQMKQVNISNFKQLLSSTEFNTVLSDECPNSAYNSLLHIYMTKLSH